MKHFLLLATIFLSIGLNAQKATQKKIQTKIIVHKVEAGENLYAISRKYKVAFADLVAANKFDRNHNVKIGESINVPTKVEVKADKKPAAKTVTNKKDDVEKTAKAAASAKAASAKKETTKTAKAKKPFAHKVEAGENLYAVARKYNITLNELVAANKFDKSYNLKIGEVINIPANATVKTTEKATVKTDTKKAEAPKPETKKTTQPDPRDKVENKKKAEPAPLPKPVEEKKEIAQKTAPASVSDIDGSGYFKKLYVQQVKKDAKTNDKEVVSGIFKTNKGWAEGKFYVLMDGVQTGEVVKVINPANNLIVYAKVLGKMQGLPESNGYDIRISDAAAALLDISNTEKFPLKIVY